MQEESNNHIEDEISSAEYEMSNYERIRRLVQLFRYKKCTHCQKIYYDADFQYCPECGNSLTEESTTSPTEDLDYDKVKKLCLCCKKEKQLYTLPVCGGYRDDEFSEYKRTCLCEIDVCEDCAPICHICGNPIITAPLKNLLAERGKNCDFNPCNSCTPVFCCKCENPTPKKPTSNIPPLTYNTLSFLAKFRRKNRYCHDCQVLLKEGSQICPYCGQKTSSVDELLKDMNYVDVRKEEEPQNYIPIAHNSSKEIQTENTTSNHLKNINKFGEIYLKVLNIVATYGTVLSNIMGIITLISLICFKMWSVIFITFLFCFIIAPSIIGLMMLIPNLIILLGAKMLEYKYLKLVGYPLLFLGSIINIAIMCFYGAGCMYSIQKYSSSPHFFVYYLLAYIYAVAPFYVMIKDDFAGAGVTTTWFNLSYLILIIYNIFFPHNIITDFIVLFIPMSINHIIYSYLLRKETQNNNS